MEKNITKTTANIIKLSPNVKGSLTQLLDHPPLKVLAVTTYLKSTIHPLPHRLLSLTLVLNLSGTASYPLSNHQTYEC